MRTRGFGMVGAVISLTGCMDQGFHTLEDGQAPGLRTLSGRICSADGRSWLDGALVYTYVRNEEGEVVTTVEDRTDPEGRYLLEGLYEDSTVTLYVEHAGALVQSFEVEMPGNADLLLPDPPCMGVLDLTVAHVSGDYDDFGPVLEGLGITDVDPVNGLTGHELAQFLTQPGALALYDVVLFSGGHIEEDVFYDLDQSTDGAQVALVHEHLRAYVEGGGVVLASDWSYDVIEGAWPQMLDFYGDDLVPDAAQKGEADGCEARVQDDGLRALTSADTLWLDLGADTWPVATDVGPEAQVLLSGKVQARDGTELTEVAGSPLLVRKDVGEGQVWFSSFRHQANFEGDAGQAVRYVFQQMATR